MYILNEWYGNNLIHAEKGDFWYVYNINTGFYFKKELNLNYWKDLSVGAKERSLRISIKEAIYFIDKNALLV